MNKLILSLATLTALSISAAEIPCNGDFEKCTPAKNGILMPEGWEINKGQTKKAEVQNTNEEGAAHKGKFALDFEVEKGGQAFLTYWGKTNAKVNLKDKVKMSAYVKGSGSFSLAYILYGVPEGGKHTFMWTAIVGKFKASGDQYQKFEKEITLRSFKKNGKECSNVMLYPVILVHGDSTLLMDDYTVTITSPAEKATAK